MHYRDRLVRCATLRRACEHVTGITVRHEGKPSGFGRVRLDIGVIPQRQIVEKVQTSKAFPARGDLAFTPSQSQSRTTSCQNPALPLVIILIVTPSERCGPKVKGALPGSNSQSCLTVAS